jgi:hypothetical protein
MSTEKKDTDNDSFPEENNLDDQTAVDGLDESDQEEDSEVSSPQENLYDLMADFFVNENGDNMATVLTNVQNSIDQNSKCILKLTKVIQDYLSANSNKK